MNDTFTGTFRYMWLVHTEERAIIALIALPCWIGSGLVLAWVKVLELLGFTWRNPFYKEPR